MLLQESVRMSMSEVETMDVYLRAVREKMSELTAVVGLELEDDVKLAIILNVVLYTGSSEVVR